MNKRFFIKQDFIEKLLTNRSSQYSSGVNFISSYLSYIETENVINESKKSVYIPGEITESKNFIDQEVENSSKLSNTYFTRSIDRIYSTSKSSDSSRILENQDRIKNRYTVPFSSFFNELRTKLSIVYLYLAPSHDSKFAKLYRSLFHPSLNYPSSGFLCWRVLILIFIKLKKFLSSFGKSTLHSLNMATGGTDIAECYDTAIMEHSLHRIIGLFNISMGSPNVYFMKMCLRTNDINSVNIHKLQYSGISRPLQNVGYMQRYVIGVIHFTSLRWIIEVLQRQVVVLINKLISIVHMFVESTSGGCISNDSNYCVALWLVDSKEENIIIENAKRNKIKNIKKNEFKSLERNSMVTTDPRKASLSLVEDSVSSDNVINQNENKSSEKAFRFFLDNDIITTEETNAENPLSSNFVINPNQVENMEYSRLTDQELALTYIDQIEDDYLDRIKLVEGKNDNFSINFENPIDKNLSITSDNSKYSLQSM